MGGALRHTVQLCPASHMTATCPPDTHRGENSADNDLSLEPRCVSVLPTHADLPGMNHYEKCPLLWGLTKAHSASCHRRQPCTRAPKPAHR